MSALGAILVKELRIEFRNKHVINLYLILSLLILAAFRFAFFFNEEFITDLAAPILWITIFFSAMFSLAPTYRREVDQGTREGLLLAPIPTSSVYFGKLLANLVVIFSLELFSVALFFLFFPVPLPDLVALATVLVLGTLGFVILGNLISAISSNLSRSEIMLPVLLVPLLLFTVVMSSIEATAKVFDGSGLGDITEELRLVGAFSVVYLAVGYLLIDYVLEG